MTDGSNRNLEPLKLNEGKALKHGVALQDNAVYESYGGTIKVNSNWSTINMLHVHTLHMHVFTRTHTRTYTHIITYVHTNICACI